MASEPGSGTASGSGSGSSSGSSERFTIAYSQTPAIADRDSGGESSVRNSSSSSSIETPRSELSYTSLFDEINETKKDAEFFGYEPRRSAASLHAGPQLDGLEYFWSHGVFQLLCFMMSHLLARSPDNPVAFLRDLVVRCLKYRDRGAGPPLLFDEPHVRSVYTSLDPGGDGHILYTQYVTGMKTLGLTEFNLLSGDVECVGKYVEEELFVTEARRALLRQLDAMLGPSRPATGASTDGGGEGREEVGEGGDEAWLWQDMADTSSEQLMTRWDASDRSLGKDAGPHEQLVTRFTRAPGNVSSSSLGVSSRFLGVSGPISVDQQPPSSGLQRSTSAAFTTDTGSLKAFISAVRDASSKGPLSAHTAQAVEISSSLSQKGVQSLKTSGNLHGAAVSSLMLKPSNKNFGSSGGSGANVEAKAEESA